MLRPCDKVLIRGVLHRAERAIDARPLRVLRSGDPAETADRLVMSCGWVSGPGRPVAVRIVARALREAAR